MGSALLTLSKGTWIHIQEQTPHTSDNLMRSVWQTDGFTAVAQFTIPSNLRYKRFTNATLIIYSTAGSSGGYDQGTGLKISPYKTRDTLDSLIWSNVAALGERGDIITVEPLWWTGDSFPRWRYIDVTSIFTSNLVDATYFTVMINAFPGVGVSYTGIGNASLTDYETKLSLTYEDVPQLPPAPSYPVGTYVNENTDLLFAWNWEATTGATQAAVQLEYKLKTAESWTVVSLTQTTHTYLLTGGLSQGVYQWRIKGTNDAGEVSDYSSIAEFNVVGQPAAPVIANVPNRALTEIIWTTADQNAFDIQIIDSNNKAVVNDSVASAVASYKPNVFLKGSYTAKVRVRNSTGLVSEWGTKSFTINAAGPSKPAFNLLLNDTKANIKLSQIGISFDWEVGGMSGGADFPNDKRLRTIGYYNTKNTKVIVDSGWYVYIYYYDADYVYQFNVGWRDETIDLSQTYPYFRIMVKNEDAEMPMDTSYGVHINGSSSIDTNDNPPRGAINAAVIRTDTYTGKEEILGKMVGGNFIDSTFGFGIPYMYVVRSWSTGGYTDSDPNYICYEKSAIVLETSDDELEIDKSEDVYLPYAEDISNETAVYNCIGRELPIIEHGAFSSRAFKSRLYIYEDQKERLVAMAKKDRIYYRDYSGRTFPVAIQPPISFERWMGEGYMADINFIRIADTEVVVNV